MPDQNNVKIKYTPVAERTPKPEASEASKTPQNEENKGGGLFGAIKGITGALTGFVKPERTPPIFPGFSNKTPQQESAPAPGPQDQETTIQKPKQSAPVYVPVAQRKSQSGRPVYIPVAQREAVVSESDKLPFTQKELEKVTTPELPKQKNIFTFLGNALLSEEAPQGTVIKPTMPTAEQLQNPRIRDAYARYIDDTLKRPLAQRVGNAWDVWKDFSQNLLQEQVRFNQNLVSGGARTTASLARALEWQGVDAAAPVADKINAWVETIEPENQRFADAIAQGIGSSAPFFVSGMGIMRGAQMLNRVSPLAARIFGGGTATFLEAAAEAGNVYESNLETPLKEGETEETRAIKAKNAADRTFLANALAIGVTNHFGIFNTNVRNTLKRVLISMPLEGLQESYQQIISNVNTDRPWHEGVIESGAIGAIIGGIFGGAAGLRQHTNVVPDPTRTYGSTKLDIKSAEAFDIDGAIQEGDINPEQVYANAQEGILTPEFAEGRIADIALKLDRFEPGLGAQLRAEIDPRNTTYQNIIDTGISVLNAATGNALEQQIESDTTAVLPPRERFRDEEQDLENTARNLEEDTVLQEETSQALQEYNSLPETEVLALDDALIGDAYTIEELSELTDVSEGILRARGIQIQQVEKAIEPLERQLNDVYSELPDFRENLEMLMVQLEISEPGQRMVVSDPYGPGNINLSRKSTFPEWLPPELRRSDLIYAVMPVLQSGRISFPKGNRTRQRAFLNELLNTLDQWGGVDTSRIRNDILDIYANPEKASTRAEETPAERTRRGTTRSEGSNGRTLEIQTGERQAQTSTQPEESRVVRTQKEIVQEAIQEEPKSIKEISEETGILEPNVRRILGVGAKEGTFERVDRGVYVYSNGNKDVAFIETGNAVESLPRLAAEGFKVDMVFLDIPYDTPAVKGGNRGVEYNLISVDEFRTVMKAVSDIVKDENTPVLHMFSQAQSGLKKMEQYNNVLLEEGFKPVARGEYQKLFKNQQPVSNVRGEIAKPEGIILFTKSGTFEQFTEDINLNFKFVRPRGYQTEKPAQLLRSLIEMTTKEGDILIDPFAGSGVTGAEAVRTGRRAYLIEKNEDVVEKFTRPRVKEAVQEVRLKEEQLESEEDITIPGLNEKENAAVNRARKSGGIFTLGDGNLASTRGEDSKNINNLIERFKKDTTVGTNENGAPIVKVPEDFKISKKALELIEELTGSDVREKKLSRRFAGLYKGASDTIRVQAIYDITTLIHEAVHSIDRKNGTINKLRGDLSADSINARKELQRAYKALYPVPKESASTEEQLREGLAVIIENYFYDPAGTAAQFPTLIDAFISPDGIGYDPKYTELLQRVETLVGEYANLTPEERIASRVRTGREVVEKDTGFSFVQRFIYEAFDIAEPLRRYAKRAGVAETWDDPTIQMFNLIDKNAIVAQWVKGNIRPLLSKDGNYKFNTGTVADYLSIAVYGKEKGQSWWKKVGQNQGIETLLTDARLKEFRAYLISRRIVEMHNRVVDLKNAEAIYEDEIASAKVKLKDENITKKAEKEAQRDQKRAKKLLEAVKEEREEIEGIMEKDAFSLEDAYAVVRNQGDKFKDAVAVYDKINNDLLELSVNTGLISKEKAEEYRSEKGYTSFRRFVDDKLSNSTIGTMSTSSKGNVSSFKHRVGSNLDIIDPFYSQIFAINEVVRKGYENLLWQKVANLADKNPEMARRFERVDTIVAIDGNGKPFYPQLNDPTAIGVLRDGKRVFYQAGPEFIAVAKQFRSNEMDFFAAILRIPSAFFTRMTTTAFPIFAATNFTIDQFAATAQTKKGFTPVVDPAKNLVRYISEQFGEGEGFIERYKALGGTQINFARAYDLSPEDISRSLLKQDTKAQKVANVVDSGLDILELPTNTAELLTRFSEFKRSHDKGEPLSVAMYRASEVSVPFQMRGNLGGRAGQAYVRGIPYLNALLQVLYKFGRAAKANPTRVSTVAASILTAGIAFAIWALTAATDRQRRTLANLPARELARAIYIPLPDGENLLRIRVPEQFGSITGIAMLFVIDEYGYNPAELKDFFISGSAWLPDPINFTDPGKMAASLIPQVIKPTAQVGLNVRTYPEIRPIVPDYLKDAKKSEQYTAYTTDVAKWLGKMFNASPILIDYWISQQFGRTTTVLTGKVPNAPITTGERNYVMTGRAYNIFYEDRAIIGLQYDKIRQAKTLEQTGYSPEERVFITQQYQLYEDVADELARMRNLSKAEVEIPEEIRESAYQMLLVLNYDSDFGESRAALSNFRSKLRPFEAQNVQALKQ